MVVKPAMGKAGSRFAKGSLVTRAWRAMAGWFLAILRGISNGMAFLHKHGVAHRDLKSANVRHLCIYAPLLNGISLTGITCADDSLSEWASCVSGTR